MMIHSLFSNNSNKTSSYEELLQTDGPVSNHHKTIQKLAAELPTCLLIWFFDIFVQDGKSLQL